MRQQSEEAVSPVVGVILLVAVTVILSAVIGAFVVDLGQGLDGQGSQDLGVQTTQDGGQVSVQVITGETDELQLLVNGSVQDTLTNARPGDGLSANANSDSDITVISVTNGERKVVSNTNPFASDSSSVSAPTAPTDGLVAHYEFETGSGSTVFDSAGANDGSRNGPVWTTPAKVGEYMLSFDGTDDNARITDSSDFTTENVTISAWVKLGASEDQYAVIAGSGGGWSDEGYHLMKIRSGASTNPEHARFEIQDSSSNKLIVDSNTRLSVGEWYHVVGVYNNKTGKGSIYIDGSYENGKVVAMSSPVNPSADMGVGYSFAPNYGGDYWNGAIDDVRIYNRVLSETEISDLYNATK